MFTDGIHLTVLVADVDDAIECYTETFGFELRADDEFAPGTRWVIVAPAGGDTEIVLQEPSADYHGETAAASMRERIGEGTTTVLSTDDCRVTVETLREHGVTVVTEPEPVPWGIHATVEDCYGNPYNLVKAAEDSR